MAVKGIETNQKILNRVMGQRSIPPSFFFRPLDRSKNIEEDVQIKAPIKDKRISLSDFLNRKLHKTSVLPKTVQGKQRPFSSPVTCQDVSGSIQGQIGVNNGGEAEMNCVLDEMVFKQFKHTRKEKDDCIGSCSVSEVGIGSRDDVQKSLKRRNPFEGGDEKPPAQKHLVILGDDPIPKQKRRKESFICNKRSEPVYNHYANGSGWWDCNMEGVDNEEVGCNEVWEGVGSTTLGGLEWH